MAFSRSCSDIVPSKPTRWLEDPLEPPLQSCRTAHGLNHEMIQATPKYNAIPSRYWGTTVCCKYWIKFLMVWSSVVCPELLSVSANASAMADENSPNPVARN